MDIILIYPQVRPPRKCQVKLPLDLILLILLQEQPLEVPWVLPPAIAAGAAADTAAAVDTEMTTRAPLQYR